MNCSLEQLVDLQLHGVCGASLEPGRRGGAGPSGTKAFMVKGRCLMLPVGAQLGAWNAERRDCACTLGKEGASVEASLVETPKFYELQTADGISYKKIALLHGRNCLASTVLQTCSRYAHPSTRCRFCALGKSLQAGDTIARKTPAQLVEVAQAAKRLDGVSHVTLTSGTTPRRDEGILYIGQCAGAITEATGLPVQIQFEPPEDFSLFETLHGLNVANVSMHVESLDEQIRRRMTPGKAEISLSTYFEAFEKAVAVFGRNRVSTYVILGLGEDRDATLARSLELVDMGVYPNIVPLHPLPGTYMEHAQGPDPHYLLEVYREVGRALRARGMSHEGTLAGCACCGACSLLQYTEDKDIEPAEPAEAFKAPAVPPARRCRHCGDGTGRKAKDAVLQEGRVDTATTHVDLTVAELPEDVAECLEIRREVFCQEQGIFNGNDEDEHDEDAVHILARVNGQPAGVVRCFERRPGVWVGGRLAVRRQFRCRLGAQLVRKAVKVMEERDDVRRFFAIVQIQNVRFFKLLRWKPLGKPFFCNGVEHQLMEKELKREAKA